MKTYENFINDLFKKKEEKPNLTGKYIVFSHEQLPEDFDSGMHWDYNNTLYLTNVIIDGVPALRQNTIHVECIDSLSIDDYRPNKKELIFDKNSISIYFVADTLEEAMQRFEELKNEAPFSDWEFDHATKKYNL